MLRNFPVRVRPLAMYKSELFNSDQPATGYWLPANGHKLLFFPIGKFLLPGCNHGLRWLHLLNWQNYSERTNWKWVEMGERSWSNSLPFPLLSCDSWMVVRENPDRKKKEMTHKFRNHSMNTYQFRYKPESLEIFFFRRLRYFYGALVLVMRHF